MTLIIGIRYALQLHDHFNVNLIMHFISIHDGINKVTHHQEWNM